MIIQYPGLVYTLTAAWDNSPSLVYTLTPAWDNSPSLVYTLTSSLVYSLSSDPRQNDSKIRVYGLVFMFLRRSRAAGT